MSAERAAADGLSWARWAVDRWADFPALAAPRPIVLVGPRVMVERGFTTPEAKLAFLGGRVEPASAFLGGRVEPASALPAAVVEQILRDASPVARARTMRPLAILAAHREEAEFHTDRGPRRLPAWRLSVEGTRGPVWVLDPSVSDWQPAADAGGAPPPVRLPSHQPQLPVEVGDDDRSLVVHWLGGAPSVERYRNAEVMESTGAVAVVPVAEEIGGPGPRTAVGYVHRVAARLREPLGGRVIVSLGGEPREVITGPERGAA